MKALACVWVDETHFQCVHPPNDKHATTTLYALSFSKWLIRSVRCDPHRHIEGERHTNKRPANRSKSKKIDTLVCSSFCSCDAVVIVSAGHKYQHTSRTQARGVFLCMVKFCIFSMRLFFLSTANRYIIIYDKLIASQTDLIINRGKRETNNSTGPQKPYHLV